jgi:uncharacterized protein YbjT (DUF2867 family)
VNIDTSRWPAEVAALSPPPNIFISALGTTRSAAGGFQQQYKLEHGVNVELARAARDAGTRVYVLISSGGADKNSIFPYTRMKGEIEEDIKALGFEHTVLLQPGLIAGKREESRPLEAVLRFVAETAGKVHPVLKDSWIQDADVIGKAAVHSGFKALQGDVPVGCEKVWILDREDIIRLGRTEWNDAQ